MNINEYSNLALRTLAPQSVAFQRLASAHAKYMLGGSKLNPMQLLHSIIGMMGELGELCTAIQRWIWYGKGDPDIINLLEEFGDSEWYWNEGVVALGISPEECLRRNIAKLCKRYKERYTDYQAAEENRDRAAERQILEATQVPIQEKHVTLSRTSTELSQTGQGWAEYTEFCNDTMGVVDSTPEVDQTMPRVGPPPIMPPAAISGTGPYRDIEHYKASMLALGRHPGASYNRLCPRCKTNPIHDSNTIGVCPNCIDNHLSQSAPKCGCTCKCILENKQPSGE